MPVAKGGKQLFPSVSQERAFGRCEEVERDRHRGIGSGGRHRASIARAVSRKAAASQLKCASGGRVGSALVQPKWALEGNLERPVGCGVKLERIEVHQGSTTRGEAP